MLSVLRCSPITRETLVTLTSRPHPPGQIKVRRWNERVRAKRCDAVDCLEMSPVFNLGEGLRCGLSIRHCRCNWIMAAWVVFLHLFLVPLCWCTVSKRQMLLIFCGRFIWNKQTSLSNGFSGYFHDSTTELYFCSITPTSMLFLNKNN